LRLVHRCAICREPLDEYHESFQTPGAVYHADCYERETGLSRRKITLYPN
jgi:recombinational DNA repair protein (RecF pathway)